MSNDHQPARIFSVSRIARTPTRATIAIAFAILALIAAPQITRAQQVSHPRRNFLR